MAFFIYQNKFIASTDFNSSFTNLLQDRSSTKISVCVRGGGGRGSEGDLGGGQSLRKCRPPWLTGEENVRF